MFEDDVELDEINIELQPLADKRRLPVGPEPAGQGSTLMFWGDKDQSKMYISWEVLKTIIEHAESSLEREIGGFLLGTECMAEHRPCLDIKQAIKACNTIENAASITFTHATWERFGQEHAQQWPNYGVAGWYHSHPGFGVFLSEYDLFIHRNFFNAPFHVALVIDPIDREIGFFIWRDNDVRLADGFAVYIPEESKDAAERMINDWTILIG
ncbi:MAG: Mov34/MPN/PAD-1 family protein [Acidobacteriota bacterium]